MDSDEGVMVVHCAEPEADEHEAETLVAMLYVFLVSHVVVVCDVFFDVEWIRRLRIIQEMRRSVQKQKGNAAHLVFCIEDPTARFGHIADMLSEYRGFADASKRLFRLADTDATSLKSLLKWYERNNAGKHALWLPNKISAKRDLLELARSLVATGERPAPAALALPVAPVAKSSGSRRIVAACNCGLRQVVLRDVTEPALAPCCADNCIPLSSGSAATWLWCLCTAPGERGPGFVDASPTIFTQKGISFGVEYECWSGHRFFLTENMAKVVMRLNHPDKLLSTDVPLYIKCLACKQDTSDAPPAQLMRVHVQATAAALQQQVWLDPVVKFKHKSSSTIVANNPNAAAAATFSMRLPCGPILVCGSVGLVLRLPRAYHAPDGTVIVQKDVTSPFAASLCASWLSRQ